MNLLKQTSLILGLASLSIGAWTLYRNWKQKLAIWFTVLCLCISIWALSFVSHATLFGRLSKDIHWFFHLWLVPISVTILSKILSREDRFSEILRWFSFLGASILGVMVALSMGESPFFWNLVSFWPFLVVIQFIYVMVSDLFFRVPLNIDFFSPNKRIAVYFGLALSLITCSFDHIPELGYEIPAVGNLLLTVYLLIVSQMVSPLKLLNIPALASRFFATVILSLVITGFFALLYQYMSESFPLFFLNSFLVTFAVLILWSPLLSFFRFVSNRFGKNVESVAEKQLSRFLSALPMITDREALLDLIQKSFQVWIPRSKSGLWMVESDSDLPVAVSSYFQRGANSSLIPVIHRELILMERDQVVTDELKKKLEAILQYLDLMEVDLVFPIYPSPSGTGNPSMLVMVSAPVSIDDWRWDFGFYSRIFRALQEIERVHQKIIQIDLEKAHDRLVLMGEMAAGLAHEVRNPLSAIQGATDLLQSDNGPWVGVIRDEVQRLNRLVNQFLDFANSPKEKFEELNLGEILQKSIENLSGIYQNQVRLEFESLVSGPVLFNGVADHVQQILMNLIQNSIKAEAKTIRVVLTLGGFEVHDDGVGMTPEVLSKVFQPFFTSFKSGSGLGLSICERLVRFIGGEIKIESEKGRGTQVKVRLCANKSL